MRGAQIQPKELLPGGIVLTGGGAKIPRIKELTKETFKLACEIGIPKQIMGLEEDPSLATVAGLALGGVDFDEEESILGVARGWGSKFKKMFRVFLP